MTTLTEDIELPGGTDPATVTVRIQLWGDGEPVTGYEQSTGKTIGGELVLTGTPWTAVGLVGNADIDAPTGTVYRVLRTWPGLREPLVDYVTVPTSGSYRVDQVLTDPPGALTPSGLAAHQAAEGAHGWTLDPDGSSIVWDGAIHTNHDAKYFYPAGMKGTAQDVSNAGTLGAPPYWAFDQTVVERVKWTWTPGDAWDSYVVRLGWLNTGFGAGNVRWRYYERRNVANAGSPTGDWTTAPTQVAEITSAAPLINANKYEDLAVAVPVTPLAVVMSVIERISAGVPSNLPHDAGLYIVTATRT